jgi:hypothetical protein
VSPGLEIYIQPDKITFSGKKRCLKRFENLIPNAVPFGLPCLADRQTDVAGRQEVKEQLYQLSAQRSCFFG